MSTTRLCELFSQQLNAANSHLVTIKTTIAGSCLNVLLFRNYSRFGRYPKGEPLGLLDKVFTVTQMWRRNVNFSLQYRRWLVELTVKMHACIIAQCSPVTVWCHTHHQCWAPREADQDRWNWWTCPQNSEIYMVNQLITCSTLCTSQILPSPLTL